MERDNIWQQMINCYLCPTLVIEDRMTADPQDYIAWTCLVYRLGGLYFGVNHITENVETEPTTFVNVRSNNVKYDLDKSSGLRINNSQSELIKI